MMIHAPNSNPSMMMSSPRRSSGEGTMSRTPTKSRPLGGSVSVSLYSNRASEAISQGEYQSAIKYYEVALKDYLTDSATVVELVNAAATCFNLGALYKKLQDYHQAVDFFCQAEDLYRTCSEKVEDHCAKQGQQSTSSSSSCKICLIELIAETLQARAHLHYKYQRRIDDAIECHEEVLTILDEEQTRVQINTCFCKIHFYTLGDEERLSLLVNSLQTLGKIYVERGELEDALIAYQEALALLKRLPSSTRQRQDEIAQIVKALSEMFVQTSSSTGQISELQQQALLQEDLANWEKALQCWEKVLFYQSQEHGENSMEVAGTLCQLARVMVEEGNHEGALHLYHAAAKKYNTIEAPVPNDLISRVSQLYCQMKLWPDGKMWLENLLAQSQTEEEKCRIYFELGKLHLEEGHIDKASEALCEGEKHSDSDDEHLFKLLQKVEFLQQQADPNGSNMVLTSITEGEDESTLGSILGSTRGSKVGSKDEEPSRLANERKSQRKSSGLRIDSALLEDDYEEKKVDDISLSSETKKGSELFRKEKDAQNVVLDGLVFESMESLPMVAESPFDEAKTEAKAMLPGGGAKVSVSRGSYSSEEDVLNSGDRDPTNLCPIKSDLYNESLTTTQESDQSYYESKIEEEAASSASNAKLQQAEEEAASSASNAKLQQAEDSSKSTDETAPSDESSPAIRPSLSAPSESIAADSDIFSDLGSEIKSRECGGKDGDGNEKEASNLDSASQISDLKSLDTLDEDDLSAILETPPSKKMVRGGSFTTESILKQSDLTPTSHSQSPLNSASSRTGLLKSEEKQHSINKGMGIRMPTLSSPRNGKNRDRRERSRFAKALSSPFRRSRSKRNPHHYSLDALDENQEVNKMRRKFPQRDIDDFSASARNAPVSFVSVRGRLDDDDETQVSQITFMMEERSSRRRSKGAQWWWGVTTEGLEGWFPSTYVNQAVQAAEGFLSAKDIHDKVKSRPLDFDSDEESEEEDGSKSNTMSEEKGSKDSKDSKTSKSHRKPENVSETARKASMETTDARPLYGSASVANSNSGSSKKTNLTLQIQELEELLRKQQLESGPEHITVASTLFSLSMLLGKKGDTFRAIENAQHALEIQKSTSNSSGACRSLYLMADMHIREDQYKAALSCLSEAQSIQVRVLGYYHEDTANTLNRIGNVLARQGEFDLAMENHKDALAILRKCFGEDVKNPLVSQTLIQIGAVYYKERNSLLTIQSKSDGYKTFIEGGMLEIIGRAHEERGSYRMAIAFFEEKLQFLDMREDSDDDHLVEQVAETLNSLGMLSCRAGLYLEAIDYYDRALEIQMKFGCDPVQLAMARVLAGSVQHSLGHYKKALKLFQDAIKTLRELVGPEQETVAATLFHMGVVRGSLCEYDDAMKHLQDALTMQKKLLGGEHPATLRTRREVANLFAVYPAELDSALNEYDEILSVQELIHGEKHPNVAETLHSIGCAQARKGDFSVALRTLEDCYNMRLEFLGMDHPLQATTLHEIAKIHLKRGRLKKALHICDSALTIRVESLSEQHIDVAVTMVTKASCLVAKNNFADANRVFCEALSIADKAVGSMHPSVADIYVQMGTMHLRKCHFEEASNAMKKALDIYRASNLDDDHPAIKEAKKELQRVERAEMLCV